MGLPQSERTRVPEELACRLRVQFLVAVLVVELAPLLLEGVAVREGELGGERRHGGVWCKGFDVMMIE